MSYESEERYWTDYLRVALPVIGLLLMLALFWWWAQKFIGEENTPEGVALTVQTEVATTSAPTPTFTVQPTLQVTEQSANTPTDNGGASSSPDDKATEQPQDCGYAEGDTVVTTEDGVNLRSDPTTQDGDNVIVQLDAGTSLQIMSSCYTEEGDNKFWQVNDKETAQKGWVSADFIQPASN